MHVNARLLVWICTVPGFHSDPEMVLGPLDLELQVVVNCSMGAGTEPRSSLGAVSAFNHRATFPASTHKRVKEDTDARSLSDLSRHLEISYLLPK